MKSLLTKIPDSWREAWYYALVVIFIALFAFNVITEKEVGLAVTSALKILTAASFFMAAKNVPNNTADKVSEQLNLLEGYSDGE